MKKNKLRYSLILIAGLKALAFSSDTDTRLSILEAQIAEVSTRTIHGNYGGKTASASPQFLGQNWFFTAGLLWWHASEGGMDYAQLFYGNLGVSSSNSVYNRKLDFKQNLGFRTGIGTTFNHDKWDLYLNFTWFKAENSAASSLHSGRSLTPLAMPSPSSASQVKIHWDLAFYTLDLNLGRHYFVSSKLALHPYVGLKGASIPQHIRTKGKIFAPDSGSLKVKQKNEFWGAGPNLGLEGKWFLAYGVNLFAAGGASLLWGDFDIQHRVRRPLPSESFNLDIHEVVPVAQMQIGIGYETNFHHNIYHISIKACYETQYFWNQNQLPYFSSIPSRFQRYSEDLSLQGLTVNARFDF